MPSVYDVLLVGDYYFDLIFTGLESLPEAGREVFSQGFEMLPGGAYNAAVAMQRLGLRVCWAADFGNDEFSRRVITSAAGEGLSTEHFTRHDRPMRRITVAASLAHERAFLSYIDPEPSIPAGFKAAATLQARCLLIPGLYMGSFFEAGLKLVRARGMKLVMDGNSSGICLQDKPGLKKILRALDVFIPNAAEARCLTGCEDLQDALQILAGLCPLVVIKDGANGGWALGRDGQTLHVPALALTPLETTGAGDCFDAGFILAWLANEPLEVCLRYANICGGLSTLAPGGTGQVTRLAELHARLKDYPNG